MTRSFTGSAEIACISADCPGSSDPIATTTVPQIHTPRANTRSRRVRAGTSASLSSTSIEPAE